MTSPVPFLGQAYGLGASNPSFDLPLADAGSGIVSLVPRSSSGSATPTFTRATTAYVEDFEGLMKLVLSGESRFTGARRVWNIVPADPDTWTTKQLTVTSGQSAPDGTSTAYRITCPANGYQLYRGSVVIGTARRNSVWIRRAVGAGDVYMSTGAAALERVEIKALLTSSWQRLCMNVATATDTTGEFGFQIVTTGDAIDIWHPQGEDVTGQANQAPSEYVSVGVESAPYHGANVDGVKYFSTENGNTVASNVVTEATGAAISSATLLGYQAEGARADVLGATAAIRRTMADAGWVAGATMTLGSATGIDGVASAGASLTGGAVEATNTILFTTVLASAARTYSAWVRRKTGTGTVRMTDNGGTNWTDITLTTTYTQFQVTRTQANPIVGFQIATNLDAIEVDFNTIEAAAFANPTPIPVNVSKAEDALSYPTAGNFVGTQGTAYAELQGVNTGGQQNIMESTGYPMYNGGTSLNMYDGSNAFALGSWTVSSTVTKVATSWSGSVANGFINGALGATSPAAFDGNLNLGANMNIISGANQFWGTIKNIKIWPVALPAATLQALTT